METVSRKLLLDLMDLWKKGDLDETQLHERAEALWEQKDWPLYAEDDPHSIAIEVLSQLDILNHQLITREDIPAIVDFLSTPEGQEKAGWDAWKRYWDDMNLEKRKNELKNNSYYIV